MIQKLVFLLTVILYAFLVSSCSSIQTAGSIVKPAGYENEKTGWLQKNLPSLEKLSNLIPPPTDARMKWDETQKRQKDGYRAEEGF
jgi:hypothetical protein